MTIEERAKKAFDAFMNVHYMDLSDEMVMTAITQALRDQKEESDIIPRDGRLTHNGRIPAECGRCEKENWPPTHFIICATSGSPVARFFCYKCYKVVALEVSTLNSPNRK